jgi:hypothetical protein
MRTALLKRLKRLEEVRAVGSQPPLEFQIGYIKKLPEENTGERHVSTVGRAADGTYRWEERRGAPPANEDGPTSIIRLFLVRAKDGRPDYSWPEDAHALFLMR